MQLLKIAAGSVAGGAFGLWMVWLDVNSLQQITGWMLMAILISVGAWATSRERS